MHAPFNEKRFSLDWRNKIISAEHPKIRPDSTCVVIVRENAKRGQSIQTS